MTDLGRALHRLRRVRGLKQAHAADLLGVSQATVSRWEAGVQAPGDEARAALERLLAAPVAADAALQRLVETSASPTHLICDVTHVLLATSPARAATWRAGADELTGRSLFRYASPEIAAMEAKVVALGWRDGALGAVAFWTGANADAAVTIRPGLVLWERLHLADGRPVRLVSTVTAAPAHALAA
jgi:transcriptional regulator with XRE-family HTH domain